MFMFKVYIQDPCPLGLPQGDTSSFDDVTAGLISNLALPLYVQREPTSEEIFCFANANCL